MEQNEYLQLIFLELIVCKENEELGEGIIFKHLKNNTLNSNQLVQNIIVEINRETPDNTQFDDITAIAIKIK